MKDLLTYFEDNKGRGILSTADVDGKVNAAVFATPHIMAKDTVAFIMQDRLTHHNLQSNAHAAYLFMEDGDGHKGIRLFLTKIREEKDSDLILSIRRNKEAPDQEDVNKARFLVFFKVEKMLPLTGAGRK